MNQDKVKEILLQIEETELEFSVIFTGKSSKKVNGLYKGDTHEILLHNKNFSVDNELLYTAIHEYTHHRLWEIDGGSHSSRVHTRRFWSYFHGLLKKAEEKGLYKITLEESPDLIELTENIRTTIMAEDGRLMKELGRLLGKARTLCKQAGVRYEDYIDRVLCLPRAAATSIEKMYAFDVNPALGYESMKVVANIGNPDKRATAEELLLNKNSPAFAQTSVAKKPPEEEPRVKLEKEKRRLEKTIASLTERLSQVEHTLANMPPTAFILCLALFIGFAAPSYSDNRSASIVTPSVPDVPSVTIQQGHLTPPKPPHIKPPVFQPMHMQTNTKKPAASKHKKKAAETTDIVNGMTAKTISNLTKGKTGLFQLQNFLGETSTDDSGNTVLKKILSELEKLEKNTEQEEQKPPEQQKKPEKIATNKETKKSEKKDAAELIRLRINGIELVQNIIYTVCSSQSEKKEFLYSADFNSTKQNEENTETMYFFCREKAEKQYEITIALHQNKANPASPLYTLKTLSPLSVHQTADLLFWHYQAPQTNIELLFRLT